VTTECTPFHEGIGYLAEIFQYAILYICCLIVISYMQISVKIFCIYTELEVPLNLYCIYKLKYLIKMSRFSREILKKKISLKCI
jgi:hypothetical protein